MKCSECGSVFGHTYNCSKSFGFPRPAPKPSSAKKAKGRKPKDDRKED